jgi:hypothetical protein
MALRHEGECVMMWSGLKTVTVLAVAALALVACKHAGDHAGRHHPKVAVHTAKQACEIDSLAREHQVLITNLGLQKSDSDTIVSEKMKMFRGEVDASYRFVVENCNNYNMCMQAHDYKEQACDQSRASWTESHRKFNELTEKLAKIDAHHAGPHHKPHKPSKPKGGCNCDEVFTTGCCNENY